MFLLRKIFFYLFLAIYVVVCPLIILYALGITFKPATKSIQKTGVISISTVPSNADVDINGRHIPQKTPAIVRNLPPGHYSLKIFLKNFLLWEKAVTVEEEKVTAAEDILLIPQEWKSTELSRRSFQELISPGNQPFFLLRKDVLLKDFFIFQWTEGLGSRLFARDNPVKDAERPQPLFPDDFLYREATLRNCFTVKDSAFFVMQIELAGKQKYIWIDPRPKPARVEDITDLFTVEPEKILWDPKQDRVIFAFQQGSINRLDIRSKAIYPNILENVRSVSAFDDQLYMLTRDNIFQRTDDSGKNPQILREDLSFSRVFPPDDKISITPLTKELVLFLNKRGALLSGHWPFPLINEGIKGFVFHPDKKRLLIWTEHQIGVIDLAKEKKENNFFETMPSLRWLTTDNQQIEQAFWVNKGTQILYRDTDRAVLLEPDDFGEPVQYAITEVRKNSPIEYSNEIGVLFYLDKKTGRLSSIEILNER